MPVLSLRTAIPAVGALVLAGNDLIELITAVSEIDPLPLLIHALGLTMAKYQSIIKPKVNSE